MERCSNCILPRTYFRISFDENGTCNYCKNHKQRQYLGKQAFIERLEGFLDRNPNRNKEYDCVLAFSGGRDSSYLLYWLTQELHLKVLAYSADNGVVPEQTINNIINIANSLNTKLIMDKHDSFKKCTKHTIGSWMKRPTLPMIEMLCTGCRLGVVRGSTTAAIKNNIPVLISGGTPFEKVYYRDSLLKLNPDGGPMSAILGYANQVIRNARWIMSPTYLDTQIKEYIYYYHNGEIPRRTKLFWLSPFLDYIRWQEDTITSTITRELNWRKNEGVASAWRGDCDIAQLKLYLYKKALGYSDKVDHLSHLIRDGQLDRQSALERLKKEEDIPIELVKDIIRKNGIDYSDFDKCVDKLCSSQLSTHGAIKQAESEILQ